MIDLFLILALPCFLCCLFPLGCVIRRVAEHGAVKDGVLGADGEGTDRGIFEITGTSGRVRGVGGTDQLPVPFCWFWFGLCFRRTYHRLGMNLKIVYASFTVRSKGIHLK